MISEVCVWFYLVGLVVGQSCYWNDGCAYQLYSSKTPYDTVRGDIRDHPIPENCEAVSIWSLNRHGNRNPGNSVTTAMRAMADLKQEIITSHEEGRGQLCAQDIENFRNWNWNETLEVSQSYLTGVGYEELFDIARRLREKYPHLLDGTEEDYYFRTTDEQRTITSAMAFVHGWVDNTNLSLAVDGPWVTDPTIRPYQVCDRYQQEVRGGTELDEQIEAYFSSSEFVTVQRNVQNRLGISTQLSSEDIHTIYEMCRFFRSWETRLQSPWCAAFTNDDLVVLEYRDDVRHYYRNAHGSWINRSLGRMPLRDLFERFSAFVQNEGHKLVAYFTHDTMIEMTTSAAGLYQDAEGVIQGGYRDPDRLFRSSYVGCFSSNIVAVLKSCQEPTGQAYRVQIFHNEQVTDLCPAQGCTWQEFRDRFQVFSNADLSFCTLDARVTETELPGSASAAGLTVWMLALGLIAAWLR